MADFTYPNSKTLSTGQVADAISSLFKNPSSAYAQTIGQDFGAIGSAEGGGRTGVTLNTAYPSLPNYSAPGAGDLPEYSVGLFGENLGEGYAPVNYNTVAKALGQPTVSGNPSPGQIYNLGAALTANPAAQGQVALQLYQGAGNSFAPWTDPVAASLSPPGAIPAGSLADNSASGSTLWSDISQIPNAAAQVLTTPGLGISAIGHVLGITGGGNTNSSSPTSGSTGSSSGTGLLAKIGGFLLGGALLIAGIIILTRSNGAPVASQVEEAAA